MATHRFPQQMTTFVGRETEITRLSRLLETDTCRLLTLTGLGGIGKSRLALEVVQNLQTSFADGIYYIPLQSLQFAGQITHATLKALQVEVQSEPLTELLAYIRDRQILLVIDNCEHLLGGFDLVTEILNTAPKVKILATSREPFKLESEWVRKVNGLSYPKAVEDPSNDRYDAVRLFVERAQRLCTDVNFTEQYPHIVRICQLVDGMPLALELAAAWVTTLTCYEIADEIQRNQDILAMHLQDMPERHRNIEAVFNQSWHLLTGEEITVLRRFAVFRGGCTRQAAEQITGASLATLSRFVEKSLLRHESEKARYDMQNLLHQYLRERLKEAGEWHQVHDIHGHYYAALCYAHEKNTSGAGLNELMHIVNTELDNLRLAWAGALERKKYETIWQLTHGLWLYYANHFHSFELGAMYESAVSQLSNHPGKYENALLGRILARYGRWRATQGDIDGAEATLQQSMTIAQEQGDAEEYYYAMRDLAWYILAVCRGEHQTALSMMEACVAYHREQNDQYYLGLSLSQLAVVCGLMGQLEKQQILLQETYQIYTDIDFALGIDTVSDLLCYKAVNEGRWSEARNFCLELVEQGKRIDKDVYPLHTVRAYMRLMVVAVMQGDFLEAETYKQVIENTFKRDVSSNRYIELIYHNHLCQCLILDANAETQLAAALIKDLTDKSEYIADFARNVSRDQIIKAWVLCSLEQYEMATAQITKILSITGKVYREGTPYMLLAIASAARILAHQGYRERAVELLGFVFRHPNSPQGYLARHTGMTRLLTHLNMQLGEDVYDAAWNRETQSDIEVIGHALVYELSSEREDDIRKVNQSLADPLTERELEVLHLLGERLSNHQIAERLFITVGTVKSYTNKIYSKLGVTNRVGAVECAQKLKLL